MTGERDAKLIEAGMTLAAELSLPAVLLRIVEIAVDLTEARYGALGVMADDGTISEFITVGVSEQERAAIGEPPSGKGILGELIRHPEPMRLDDLGADPRAHGFPPNHPPMHSFLGAPVKARGRVFGNLYLTEKKGGGPFIDDDERAVVVLGTQAGVAIENARLFIEAEQARAELERLAVMEDRERIARDIHDGAIQSLFAVGMALQGFAGGGTIDPEKTEPIEHAVDEIDRVIRDLRNYIFGLRPGIMADRQLGEALHEVAAGFERSSGVTTVTEIDARVAAECSALAADLMQLTREALSNVGRHAGATTCRVSLRRDPAGAALVIDDDGSGFTEDPADNGNGLRNIRERAEGLGGDAVVTSTLDEGTTVTVRFPV